MTETPARAHAHTLSSVERALDVIEALWQLEGAGVTELASELDMAKSTVHSHLATLHRKGYVVQDAEGYRLSLRFLTLGEHVKESEQIYVEGKPIVDELAEETDEHVLCMVEQHGLAGVVYDAKGRSSLHSEISVGTHSYLHSSAGGKAILAEMSDEEVDAVIDRWGLKEFTENTITDRDRLFEELEEVRERGIAYQREEYLHNVNAVGGAITYGDRVQGALVVIGPARRVQGDRLENEIADALLNALDVIEINMQLRAD